MDGDAKFATLFSNLSQKTAERQHNAGYIVVIDIKDD